MSLKSCFGKDNKICMHVCIHTYIHTYFIILPEGAFQRQYNKVLSTEEEEKSYKINWVTLTIAI